MQRALIETHFLPSIEYFCALAAYDEIVIEKHEHFLKQSFRNRSYILASHGIERLTVPLTIESGKVPITMARVDNASRWQQTFWRTIQSAYAKAPFFAYYADDLQLVIFSNEPFLFNLNQRLLSMCLKWLTWDKSVSETTSYEKESDLMDLRNVVSAKKDFSRRPFYHPFSYQQVFGKQFVPNLGILDLVFCTGPEARTIIQSSVQKLNK